MIAVDEGIWRQDSYSDIGKPVYSEPSLSAVEVSLPHILNIRANVASITNISLFNASQNYRAVNFGNAAGVTVTYISTNPTVTYTYGMMLGSLITEPMKIGLMRVQANTQTQITQPLNLLHNVGVGKFNGDGIYPTIFPDQYITNVAYVEKAFQLDDNMDMSYLQNPFTDLDVQFYFYQNENISLDRAFSNQPIVEKYARPQTGLVQQTEIKSSSKKFGLLLQSSALL